MYMQLTLVTVVAEVILEELLVALMNAEGATGFTATPCRGEGSRGLRMGSEPGGNVRVECIARQDVADRIVSKIAHEWFSSYAIVAWTTPVSVVRGDKFDS